MDNTNWRAGGKEEWTVKIFQSQSSPNTIESGPVLIRKIFENHQSDQVFICQCKTMYFYFASWGKKTIGAILPSAKYDWLKAKYFQQCFCLMGQNRHSLLVFPKFNKVSLGIRGKSTAGVILPLGESDCLDWSRVDSSKILRFSFGLGSGVTF